MRLFKKKKKKYRTCFIDVYVPFRFICILKRPDVLKSVLIFEICIISPQTKDLIYTRVPNQLCFIFSCDFYTQIGCGYFAVLHECIKWFLPFVFVNMIFFNIKKHIHRSLIVCTLIASLTSRIFHSVFVGHCCFSRPPFCLCKYCS